MTKYKYHTVSKKILGDLITPVSAYLKVRDAYPQSALMESSDYHSGENSKSFIAVHPIASISIEHGVGVASYPDGVIVKHPLDEQHDVAFVINEFLNNF
jgi:anthranilate synthase component 1